MGWLNELVNWVVKTIQVKILQQNDLVRGYGWRLMTKRVCVRIPELVPTVDWAIPSLFSVPTVDCD